MLNGAPASSAQPQFGVPGAGSQVAAPAAGIQVPGAAPATAADPATAAQRGTTPLAGSRAIEDAAIRWVMQLEQVAGRIPVDRRHDSKFPADLDSPPRRIEVKAVGTTTRGAFLWLEASQMEEARRNRNFYVYVVENTRQGDPTKFTLKVLGGTRLQQLLLGAKERRYFEVPWPVTHYDQTTGLEALSGHGPNAPLNASPVSSARTEADPVSAGRLEPFRTEG
jgi:hypothetical protein